MTGLLLATLREKGAAAGADLIFRTFRRQHEEKFVAGLKTLGLEALPHADACARFLYLANLAGGVGVEYMAESDVKAWIRYPPPRWLYPGAAICAVPNEVTIGFLRAFHAQCGPSLGNPRLGFVCTGMTTAGDPGLEGYFIEEDRPLDQSERLRFAPDERGPVFDPAVAPQLSFDGDRRARSQRNYSIQYIRVMLPALVEVVGVEKARELSRRAGRQIAMQRRQEVDAALGGVVEPLDRLERIIAACGDSVHRVNDRGQCLRVGAVRILEKAPQMSAAWQGILEGLVIGSDRRPSVVVTPGDSSEYEVRLG